MHGQFGLHFPGKVSSCSTAVPSFFASPPHMCSVFLFPYHWLWGLRLYIIMKTKVNWFYGNLQYSHTLVTLCVSVCVGWRVELSGDWRSQGWGLRVRIPPGAQEKRVFLSQKGCADSSVCPTPVCIRTHMKDHVRTLKILYMHSYPRRRHVAAQVAEQLKTVTYATPYGGTQKRTKITFVKCVCFVLYSTSVRFDLGKSPEVTLCSWLGYISLQ